MNLGAWVLVTGLVLFFAIYFRRRAGFRSGETLSHDNVTLRSERLGLIGRPDRIVRRGGKIIVEDKKSAMRLYDSQRAQMGVYMLLVEEHYGQKPSHAVVVLRDGRREVVKNTKALQRMVLNAVEGIREGRMELNKELRVRPSAAKCRGCGQRENCNQRVG